MSNLEAIQEYYKEGGIEELKPPTWISASFYRPSTRSTEHGTKVMSYVAGKNVGLAKNARMVFVPYTRDSGFAIESLIFALVSIAKDLEGKATNKAVINMSFGSSNKEVFKDGPLNILTKLLCKFRALREDSIGNPRIMTF